MLRTDWSCGSQPSLVLFPLRHISSCSLAEPHPSTTKTHIKYYYYNKTNIYFKVKNDHIYCKKIHACKH